VTSRFRLALVACSLTLAGCGDQFHAGPMRYVDSEMMGVTLKGKPELQKAVRKALSNLYGSSPQQIKVPEGSGLPNGGIYLANRAVIDGKPKSLMIPDPETKRPIAQQGGYRLYRNHCLHCHGVSGAGDGPTSTFLYPPPRDYRKGIFKFTSTRTLAKPTRDDLRRTIRNGLHGTSMPAFEALLSPAEIEQVIDYTIFLSMRGETELGLIDEAAIADEKAEDPLPDDLAKEIASSVFNKWKAADEQVVNPPVPRVPPTRESIMRGRELFARQNQSSVKLECIECHGPQAKGNGPRFVAQEVFNDVVFGGDPSTQGARLEKYDATTKDAWAKSLDDWKRPLRPNNLNNGVYKGGRRPIDIYWRIAKGINGAKMPAHNETIEPERIWDLVNFVLALPFEPGLLEGATLPTTRPTTAPAVARH
jgi:mono/diheme cytochrome c family protein